MKKMKNAKDLFKKVFVTTGQKFLCYIANVDQQLYSSFFNLVKNFEKNYTAKQLNFDILFDFLETKDINKTLSLTMNKIARKNNCKREDIVAIAKMINKDLLFLFPEKKKEKKSILKKKYVLQPKLVGVLQKIFETDDINWNFESSLTENIIDIYREKQVKTSDTFLPLTSLENMILSLSYLNSLPEKERRNNDFNKGGDDLDILEEVLYNSLTDKFVNEESKKYLEKKYLKDKQETKILDQYYIKNGGLVVVFPFLQYAFFRLNLTDKNNRLKDETSKSNAAQFIEFLHTGNFENSTMRMGLNQLLCGIDINDAIASEFIFSKEENKKQEEETLVKSVAEKIFMEISTRWTNLLKVLKNYDEYDEFKNISDDQIIRDYIFSRDAVINAYGTEVNGEKNILYYSMRISTKEYDEEIEKLPWSCDEIFLPYMDYKLYVEYFGGMTYDNK
jgi:hypothetical protein